MRPDPELLKLLEAHFDGRLSDSEREALTARLKADREARRAYWEMANWHNALTTWGSQYSGQQAALSESPAEPQAEHVLRFPRWVGWSIALAACVALVVFFARRAVEPSAVAHLTYSHAAVWKQHRPGDDQSLRVGEYVLEQGFARFETKGGAIVTLAAPARFRLLSSERIRLHHGRLTARMINEAATLTVQTSGIDVTDLGTAFGVDTGKDGRTLVSVFDGAVAVSDKSKQRPDLKLTEGESAAVNDGRQGRELVRTEYSPEGFTDLWPLTVGINEASRLVEFLPPGPLLRSLREYQADDRLFLFPEQQRAIVARPLAIDLDPDSPSWPDCETSPYPLSAGSVVSSYLVFFQPSPASAGWRMLRGEITFQNPVLGVICSDQALEASDAPLGIARADYSTPGQRRGLEESNHEDYRGPTLPHDSIRILPDGKTVQFEFYVSGEREQMRIIVSAQ